MCVARLVNACEIRNTMTNGHVSSSDPVPSASRSMLHGILPLVLRRHSRRSRNETIATTSCINQHDTVPVVRSGRRQIATASATKAMCVLSQQISSITRNPACLVTEQYTTAVPAGLVALDMWTHICCSINCTFVCNSKALIIVIGPTGLDVE